MNNKRVASSFSRAPWSEARAVFSLPLSQMNNGTSCFPPSQRKEKFTLVVPVEIFAAIFKIFQQDSPSLEWGKAVLVNRQARASIRRRLHLFLRTETEILRFFRDVEKFQEVFANTNSSLVFCDVEVLQVAMPAPKAASCVVLKRLFTCLSPTLLCLNIVFEEDSETGIGFMNILRQWAGSLQNLTILKVNYHFQQEENQVRQDPRYFLF